MGDSYITKNIPLNSGGNSDKDSSFAIGRRAFFDNTHKSYLYNGECKYDKTKKTSTPYTKQINDGSSNLRTQRLRLLAIGSGSSKIKNPNDKVSFVKVNGDVNYVNSALSRVRGAGYVAPKRY